MKKKLKILLILLFLFSSQSFCYAQEKIMFLDVDYIFSKSSLGKDIRQQINDKAKNLDNEKKKYKVKLEKENKDLLSKKNVLSEDDFSKKIKNLELEVKNINEKMLSKNKNLLSFKRSAESEFSKKLTEILQEYVKSKDIQIIINKKNVLIGKSEFDTTADVLSLLDSKVKKLKIK